MVIIIISLPWLKSVYISPFTCINKHEMYYLKFVKIGDIYNLEVFYPQCTEYQWSIYHVYEEDKEA